MKETPSELNARIAERVRQLRARRRLSLDSLATKSGVSRSMISLIERGESSPTAAVLEKLAAGLNVTLPSLFESPVKETRGLSGPVVRRQDQAQWRDPGSGYIRRNLTPPGAAQPMQMVEVHFPPRTRVAFESSVREIHVDQQIWVVQGAIEITIGKIHHRLREGDCLAMELDGPTMFHNPTRKTARYIVVTVSEDVRRKR